MDILVGVVFSIFASLLFYGGKRLFKENKKTTEDEILSQPFTVNTTLISQRGGYYIIEVSFKAEFMPEFYVERKVWYNFQSLLYWQGQGSSTYHPEFNRNLILVSTDRRQVSPFFEDMRVCERLLQIFDEEGNQWDEQVRCENGKLSFSYKQRVRVKIGPWLEGAIQPIDPNTLKQKATRLVPVFTLLNEIQKSSQNNHIASPVSFEMLDSICGFFTYLLISSLAFSAFFEVYFSLNFTSAIIRILPILVLFLALIYLWNLRYLKFATGLRRDLGLTYLTAFIGFCAFTFSIAIVINGYFDNGATINKKYLVVEKYISKNIYYVVCADSENSKQLTELRVNGSLFSLMREGSLIESIEKTGFLGISWDIQYRVPK